MQVEQQREKLVMKLTILIPAYNEEDTIKQVIEEIP